jgi:hypothetical protein
MRFQKFLCPLLLVCLSQAANAQTVDPFYSGTYTITNLGSITGLPTNYGGLIFKDANTIWIGGAANGSTGLFYSVTVTRGAGNHVVSFGTATALGFGTYNDGGIAFGPGGVLFYTEYPVNNMGQVLPPGYASDYKTVGLTALGIASSVGAANFVPAGHNGAGQFKVVSYNGNGFYTVPLTSDGSGGFNLGSATLETTLNTCSSTCGAEGFIYVPLGSPLFSSQSMLVSEYGSGTVGSYPIDATGNPVPASRKTFISGLTGAEGAAIDPVTGDFFFSTFGGGNEVFEVRGFAAPTAPPTIVKSFGAASIPLNGLTSLSFTISNPNVGSGLTGVGFTDSLPAGLVVSTPNGLTGSCGGGTITATDGSGVISLTGATLAATASCTFSANVTGTTMGIKNNITGAVTSVESGAGGTAAAGVTVVAIGAQPASIPALQPWALGLLSLLLIVAASVVLRAHSIG